MTKNKIVIENRTNLTDYEAIFYTQNIIKQGTNKDRKFNYLFDDESIWVQYYEASTAHKFILRFNKVNKRVNITNTLIVENRTELSDVTSLGYIASVIDSGRITEDKNGKMYCPVSVWYSPKLVVESYKNKKSDRFILYYDERVGLDNEE